MKTLLPITLLTLFSAAQAQQDALYSDYARAAVKMQSPAQSLESLRLITDNMAGTTDPARSAAKGLICATYVKAFLAAHPDYSPKRVDIGEFYGTLAEFQKTCEDTSRAALARLPKGEAAQRIMADISVSGLMTEYGDQDGSNEDKIAEIDDSIYSGGAAESFIVRLAQFQLLLDGSPEYRKARIDVGSRKLGTGEWILNETRAMAQETVEVFAKVAANNRQQANAANQGRADEIVMRFTEIYEGMLKNYAAAEADFKNGDYQDAWDNYQAVSSGLSILVFKQDDYLGLGINNRPIQVAGKTMTFEAAVRAAYALTDAARKKMPLAVSAKANQRDAIRAAWAKATAATLKGDRLKVYKLVGVPNNFTPNYTLGGTLASVQADVNLLAKASAWHYRMYFNNNSGRYECLITHTFNGNKRTGTRITAEPAYTGFILDCQQRYSIK